MLMLSRICDHLRHFRLCDFICKDPADPLSLGMYLEHNPGRLDAVHREKPLQDIDDKLHRSVVIVDQQDLVERRTLELGRRFLDDQTGVAFSSTWDLTHVVWIYRVRPAALQGTLAPLTSKNKCLSHQADRTYHCALL